MIHAFYVALSGIQRHFTGWNRNIKNNTLKNIKKHKSYALNILQLVVYESRKHTELLYYETHWAAYTTMQE